MNIKNIIYKYLKDNNYTGLCGDDCGCELEDLFPCDNDYSNCEPGYKIKCKDCDKKDCLYRNERIGFCIKREVL